MGAERDLKAMAEHVIDCTVLRDGEWTTLSSNDLVPGDVIRVEKGLAVPCDTLITTGSIIVDESSLTGEALPVRKSALDRTIDQPLTPSVLKNHLLFAGTQVSEVHMPGSLSGTNEKTVTTLLKATMAAEALVYRTSTTTDKGQLVRKILFPNPISFIFNEQLKMVIAILGLYGVFVFACGMWLMKSNLEAAWFYAMFALAQLISPILPAALVVGQSIASLRLRRKKIFCVDLPRIMIAGKVQLFCFDKTGTLTKEGLEFYGVQPIIDAASFSATAPVGHTQGPLVPQMLDEKQPYFAERQIDPLQLPTILQQGIASCHAVSNIDEQLIGNPVDIEMFRASGWTLHTPESEQYLDTVCPTEQSTNGQIHIVKRFNFDHARASMSVAVLDPTTNHVHIYVKGSFEKLRDLASASSIPSDYDHVTAQLARQGCYVLAMAHRDLGPVDPTTLHQWSRDQMEQGIALIGLVLFKNNLKPDTADAIAELKQGATRTVMITGDTALTGVFIARACGLAPPNDRMLLGDIDGKQGSVVWTDVDTDEVVDLHQVLLDARQSPEARDVELAVTGKAFNLLVMRDQIREYLLNIRVFARMTPQDKVDCVQLHMERGITAMCGDGGNDCGALRAAHVGLALSEAEASIVSPFSSSVRSIFSCVELLRQGRSALATSFAEYKYLILYGQTMAMLKFCTFYFSISISQGIWIFVDTFITVGLATAIAFSKPKRTLAWRRPTARLLGVQTLCSTIGLVAIDWLFLIFGFVMLYQQDWFRCHEFDALDVDISKWWLIADNYEAEVLALIMLFQFVNNAAVYNFGHVFRRSWWRNYPLVIIWAVFICIASYICLADPNWLGCSMRINCGTADTLVELGYPRPDFYIEPYNIDQGHNVMPKDFRYKLWGYTIGNMLAGVLWEKFVVIGPVQRLLERHFPLHRTKYKS
ncbi:hypothetical protein H4R35_003560 [Dimargaris xerosporica]|nr:hypothetical protein H4R35_003560 [Dimargaris xerosporica]